MWTEVPHCPRLRCPRTNTHRGPGPSIPSTTTFNNPPSPISPPADSSSSHATPSRTRNRSPSPRRIFHMDEDLDFVGSMVRDLTSRSVADEDVAPSLSPARGRSPHVDAVDDGEVDVSPYQARRVQMPWGMREPETLPLYVEPPSYHSPLGVRKSLDVEGPPAYSSEVESRPQGLGTEEESEIRGRSRGQGEGNNDDMTRGVGVRKEGAAGAG